MTRFLPANPRLRFQIIVDSSETMDEGIIAPGVLVAMPTHQPIEYTLSIYHYGEVVFRAEGIGSFELDGPGIMDLRDYLERAND